HRRALQPVRAYLHHAGRAEPGRLLGPAQVIGITGPQVDRGIVVDAEEVQRLADRLHVPGRDQVRGREQARLGVYRVAAVQHGFQEQAVQVRIGDRAALFDQVRTLLPEHPDRVEVERDAHRRTGRGGAQRLGGKTVAEQ